MKSRIFRPLSGEGCTPLTGNIRSPSSTEFSYDRAVVPHTWSLDQQQQCPLALVNTNSQASTQRCRIRICGVRPRKLWPEEPFGWVWARQSREATPREGSAAVAGDSERHRASHRGWRLQPLLPTIYLSLCFSNLSVRSGPVLWLEKERKLCGTKITEEILRVTGIRGPRRTAASSVPGTALKAFLSVSYRETCSFSSWVFGFRFVFFCFF